MKQMIWMVVMALAGACGGGEGTAAKQPATPMTQSTDVLVLGDATLSAEREGRQRTLALTADGKVLADGTHVLTLTTAGAIMDPQGTVHGHIGHDGKVVPVKPSQDMADMQIREDGAILDKGEVLVEFGPAGVLTGKLIESEGGGAKIAYTGAPDTRRALALAWMLASMSAEPAPAPPATAPN